MASLPTESLALRDLVRLHQVSFRVEYFGVQVCEGTAQVSFYLSLKGRDEEQGKRGGGRSTDNDRVLRVLLDVADTLPPCEEAFKQAGYDWEKRVYYTSNQGCDCETTLGLEMKVRRPFAQAAEGWEWKFLRLVTVALGDLGCRDRAAEPFQNSRSNLQRVNTARTEPDVAKRTIVSVGGESRLIA